MTNRDAGLLTFKALSIFAGIRGVEQIGLMIRAGTGPEESRTFGLIQLLAPPIILLACAILLWLGASALSSRIFRPAPEMKEGIAATLNDLQSLVFSSIGLVVLLFGVPDFVKAIVITYVSFAYYSAIELIHERNILVAVTVIKLSFGLWLFLGSNGLSRALRKLKQG